MLVGGNTRLNGSRRRALILRPGGADDLFCGVLFLEGGLSGNMECIWESAENAH